MLSVEESDDIVMMEGLRLMVRAPSLGAKAVVPCSPAETMGASLSELEELDDIVTTESRRLRLFTSWISHEQEEEMRLADTTHQKVSAPGKGLVVVDRWRSG
ncbi:hypothetical protein V5O48_016974 [Marasmius crinis-equi]|uniref:Uncharacterized protein n=1 Tax=Marasmius crinis-equi TaxID=585013 RepID=A0ABR3EQ92_9AGAR